MANRTRRTAPTRASGHREPARADSTRGAGRPRRVAARPPRGRPCSSQASRRTSPTPSACRSLAICSAAALSPTTPTVAARIRSAATAGGTLYAAAIAASPDPPPEPGWPSTSNPCAASRSTACPTASAAGAPIASTISSSVRDPSSSGSNRGNRARTAPPSRTTTDRPCSNRSRSPSSTRRYHGASRGRSGIVRLSRTLDRRSYSCCSNTPPASRTPRQSGPAP